MPGAKLYSVSGTVRSGTASCSALQIARGRSGDAAGAAIAVMRRPVTNVPIPARERINPCAASRSYAATTVARDTDSRAASSREDGSTVPAGKASVLIRSCSWA
jgi:hypothetical protein